MNEAPSPEWLELQQRLQEASRLSDEERWEEAYDLLHEEEERHPRDPTLLCMLGVVAGEAHARGLAYDYFRRCLAEQPTDPYLLVTLGAGLARYDDPEAEGVFRLAALTAPELPLARYHYGAYLAREGMLDAARAELEEALRLDPDNAGAIRELGAAYLRAGDTERGVEELERAVSLLPSEVEIRALYGLALLHARREEEAAEELHQAASEFSEDGELQLAAALACAAQEWWDHAWDALARAEGAEFAPDAALLQEAEDAMEGGSDAARGMLRDNLAPWLLHDRLFGRS